MKGKETDMEKELVRGRKKSRKSDREGDGERLSGRDTCRKNKWGREKVRGIQHYKGGLFFGKAGTYKYDLGQKAGTLRTLRDLK